MVTIYSMLNNHYVNKLKTDVFWSIRLLCELFQIKHYAVLFVYFSVYAHFVNSCSFMRTFASNKLRLSRSTLTVSFSSDHQTTFCIYRLTLHCFYLKLLFVVCCTAFKVHVCLFTHGALLREFELAPSPVEEEDFLGHHLLKVIHGRASHTGSLVLIDCLTDLTVHQTDSQG